MGRGALAALACLALTAGCTNPFGGGGVGRSVSVFSLKVGECLTPAKQVQQQLASVTVVPCNTPHTQEAYALVTDTVTNVQNPGVYPGDAALTTFAQGACAQRFSAYVGTDYQDSSLFFQKTAREALGALFHSMKQNGFDIGFKADDPRAAPMVKAMVQGLKDGRSRLLSKLAPRIGRRSRTLKAETLSAFGGEGADAWSGLKQRAAYLRNLK